MTARACSARCCCAPTRSSAQSHTHVRDDTPAQILGLQLYINGDLAESRELLLAELDRARRRGYLDHEASRCCCSPSSRCGPGACGWPRTYARGTLELTLGTDCGTRSRPATGPRRSSTRTSAGSTLPASTRRPATGRRSELGDLAFATRCAHVLGFLALSLGDADAAVRHLGPLREAEQQLQLREPAAFCIAPDLAEALVLAGDLDAAREVQAELEAAAASSAARGRSPRRCAAAGLIAAAEGRRTTALADLREALAAHDDVPQPFDRARTLLALGTVQRRAKRRGEARTTLESALAVFEELGAALWAERARAEIARLGGRRARDRDELTETERRIAELAADGRSNREIAGELFVSERTVEANLTRAYRKLGVRSRTELARRLPAD